ncbi:transporter substrate-binding domain-containing protein [Salipiger sp. 1_MG-2023]|nr:transporter substrate-binding domain-containing protein [Salipiger sp. 1_MG-2023]
MLLVCLSLVLQSWAQPASAQSERATLTTPWMLAPPFWSYGPDGEKTGFMIELAQLIADQLDHALIVQSFDKPEDMIAAQNAGQTDLIAGLLAREVFQENNLFSNPVARTRVRLFVRKENLASFDMNTARGLAVGTMGPAFPPAFKPFLDRNIQLDPTSTGQAVIGLLSGEFDAILYPEEAVFDWTIRAKIDHLILPAGRAFGQQERAVVLHRSRADLLDPINAAIARLEDSGALKALREKYRMNLYEPAPEVLTVGFPLTLGYGALAPDGTPSGFAVELVADLADRIGLTVAFVPMALPELTDAKAWEGKDMIAFTSQPDKLRQSMDVTVPVEGVLLSLVVRASDRHRFQNPEDLTGRSLGVVRNAATDDWARAQQWPDLVRYGSPQDLFSGLLRQEVDAIVMPKSTIQRLTDAMDLAGEIHVVEPHVHEYQRSIALRRGLGEIRERLNDEIPLYLVSQEHAALQQKYFGAPVFWTQARLRVAYAALAGLFALFVGLLLAFLLSDRARRKATTAHAEADRQRSATLGLSSRLQAVMDAASSGILALDRKGQIAIANPQAHELLGLTGASGTPREAFGAVFCKPDSTEPLIGDDAPFRRAMGGARLEGQLFQLCAGDGGEPRSVRLSTSPLPAELSPHIGTVIILDDVSEQERHRKEAERAGRLSAVGQLTGGIAHDFNNLLAVIMGNLELLQDDEDDPQRRRFIDAGLAATKRGADLTHSLLAFSLQARLDPEELDLNAVVLEARNWMSRALPESVSLETSLPPGLWPVSLDRTSLESALLNLILNARDAMGGQGSLTIETANLRVDEAHADARNQELAVGRYVMLAVSDTGTGIAQGTLERLFEPFFTTKGPGAGSGLGLSMVLGFVKQSGGTVHVYTELGVGTTFKLYFPTCDTGTMPVADDSPLSASIAPVGKRILLAEDEQSVRELLVTMLSGAGYHVSAAPSGDAALALFHAEPRFDLLITDIVMPGDLQGPSLAKAIRPLQPDLPMIFMSGYASESTVHGNGLRPEDIRLMKPVPKQILLAAILRALSGAQD